MARNRWSVTFLLFCSVLFLTSPVRAGIIPSFDEVPIEGPGDVDPPPDYPPDDPGPEPEPPISEGLNIRDLSFDVVSDPVLTITFHIVAGPRTTVQAGTTLLTLYDIGHLTDDPMFTPNHIEPPGSFWFPQLSYTGPNSYDGQNYLGVGIPSPPTTPSGALVDNPDDGDPLHTNLNLTYLYNAATDFVNDSDDPYDFGLFTVYTDWPFTPAPLGVNYWQSTPGLNVRFISASSRSYSVGAVPEPATWLLSVVGLSSLGLIRLRSRIGRSSRPAR